MYKPVTTKSINASKAPSTFGGYSGAEPSILYGAGSAKRAKQLQLASAGFFISGIFIMMVGIAVFGCGLTNVIVGATDKTVTGFPTGIIKALSGLLTVVNGAIIYVTSRKPVIRLARLRIMFPFTCVTLLFHLVSLVLAIVGVFNEYMGFRDRMMTSCDRDANSYSKMVADPAYSGVLLDPNYNYKCTANNPNCNIGATDQLNYNFNYWFSFMQNSILDLYNFYKFVFRYQYAIDALHIIFAFQLSAIKVGLLIIIGQLISHISDATKFAKENEPARDPTLIGSQVALPHRSAASANAPPAYSTDATHDGNGEPIYVNVSVHRPAANATNRSNWSVYTANQHGPGQVI